MGLFAKARLRNPEQVFSHRHHYVWMQLIGRLGICTVHKIGKSALLVTLGLVLLFWPSANLDAEEVRRCSENTGDWHDVSGRWNGFLGPIKLEVTGKMVHGTYKKGKWALTLQYADDRKTLFGKWDHLDGVSGPLIFYLDDRGCILHGKWGLGKEPYTPSDYATCVNHWHIEGRAVADE